MPSDRDRVRQAVLVASILVALIAGGAVGVWAVFFRGADDAASDAGKSPYEHALPTPADGSTETTTGETSGSPDATASTDGAAPSVEPTSGGSARGVPAPAAAQRAPYIAYRIAGRVVVARDDGSSPRDVATSASGVWALSPDAQTLALVDFSVGKLVLIDVAKGTKVTIGPAGQVAPVWSRDSKRILFVRELAGHDRQVLQVTRSGSAPLVLGTGSRAAFSPDGRIIAIAPSLLATARDATLIALLRDGKPWRTLAAPGSVNDLAIANDRAFVAVAPGVTPTGEPSEGIWSIPYDAKGQLVRLAQAGAAGERGVLGMLSVSDDGRYVAYSRAGDDGYSRMEIAASTGGTPVAVSSRRDAYPAGWSWDSRYAYFIEGNAWQGEDTALSRIRPDGAGKSVVVSGAGR